jgi:hypothetical protein
MADGEKSGMKLDEWVRAACAELGVAPSDAPVSLVLDLARDVAHNTVRPAAPVTAYLLGLAVGRGADPHATAAALTALAARSQSGTGQG